MRIVLATACLLAFPLALPAQALCVDGPFSRVYSFGDSLSDNGNQFSMSWYPPDPYWEGRFSNGPVWVEQLAAVLRLEEDGLKNFATGGATTTTVHTAQVQPLVVASGGQLPGDALYLYWAGANDLLTLLSNPTGNPFFIVLNAMNQTSAALNSLAGAGARNIVVANLPDFSKIPRVKALNDPTLIPAIQTLVEFYNGRLASTIALVESQTGLDIIEVDTYSLVQNIHADPRRYAITNVEESVLLPGGGLRRGAEGYLYFDDIHPTFSGHRIVMLSVFAALGLSVEMDSSRDGFDVQDPRGPWGWRSLADADINCDGRVDWRDQSVLLQMFSR